MSGIFDRLKEPSSWAGLAGILAMIGVKVDPGLMANIVSGLAAVAGMLAFFIKEKSA